MDIRRILADLRAERDRIDQAISALEALGATGRRSARRGATLTTGAIRPPRKRRHMSAAARKRISEMMKKRWAERKKKSKAA